MSLDKIFVDWWGDQPEDSGAHAEILINLGETLDESSICYSEDKEDLLRAIAKTIGRHLEADSCLTEKELAEINEWADKEGENL